MGVNNLSLKSKLLGLNASNENIFLSWNLCSRFYTLKNVKHLLNVCKFNNAIIHYWMINSATKTKIWKKFTTTVFKQDFFLNKKLLL